MGALGSGRCGEVSQPVPVPSGQADAGGPLRVERDPDAVPEEGPVSDVLEPLSLDQARFGPVRFLIRGHDLEVGDGLLEMDGVVAHHQAQVAGGVAPVVGLIVVLAVETDDHVAPVPEARPHVDLLSPMDLEIVERTRGDGIPPEAEMGRVAPVVEIVGDVSDHDSVPGLGDGVGDRSALSVQVVEAVESNQAARLHPAALDNGVVGRVGPAQPVGTVGRHDGSRMLLPDHLEAPVGIGVFGFVQDQNVGALHGTFAVGQHQVVLPVPVVLDESQVGFFPVDAVPGDRIEDLPFPVLVPAGVPHAVLTIDFQDGAVVIGPGMVRISRLAWRDDQPVRMQGIGSGSLIDLALPSRHQFEHQALAEGNAVVVEGEEDRLLAGSGARLQRQAETDENGQHHSKSHTWDLHEHAPPRLRAKRPETSFPDIIGSIQGYVSRRRISRSGLRSRTPGSSGRK